MRDRNAFTLIELLVVIAIIVALLAILLPSMSRSVDTTLVAVCGSNQRQLGTAVLTYAADHRGAIPPYRDITPTTLNALHVSRWFQHPSYGLMNFGYTWGTGHMGDGSVYYCPSQELAPFAYETYSEPAFPNAYVPGSGWVSGTRMSYNYNLVLDPNASSMTRRFTHLANFTHETLLGADLFTYLNMDDVAHRFAPGWNVIRGDGSVQFASGQSLYDLMSSNKIGLHTNNVTLYNEVVQRFGQGE